MICNLRGWLLLTLLTVLSLHSVHASAHAKVDVITFYNGDRVTGEIKGLFAGYLQVKTDAMGTINIEWQELSLLESRFNYEVRLSNGQRYFGSLSGGSRPGTLQVSGSGDPEIFDWLQVVELRPVEGTWRERIDADISLGYSYTQATSSTNSEINANLSYEAKESQTALGARYTISDTDTETARSSRFDLSRQTWSPRREDLFRAVFGNFESNDQLGLEARIVAGAGVGRYVIDTHGMRLSALIGAQVLTEDTVDTEARSSQSSSQSAELAINAGYSMWRFSTPELFLDVSASLFPSITDSGRVRAQSDISLKWELVEDLFWEVSAWGTYDNDAQSDQQYDYGITTGLGWSY
ncbi:MAG: DUF481 domain-containing protein [Pseudomonadota bacterium]